MQRYFLSARSTVLWALIFFSGLWSQTSQPSYTRQQCRYAEALLTPQPLPQPMLADPSYWRLRALVAGVAAALVTGCLYGVYGVGVAYWPRGCRVHRAASLWGMPHYDAKKSLMVPLACLWGACAVAWYWYLGRKGPEREPFVCLWERLVQQWPEHRLLVPPQLWPLGDRLAQRFMAGDRVTDEGVAERLARLWVMQAMQLRLSLGPEPVEELWDSVWSELVQ